MKARFELDAEFNQDRCGVEKYDAAPEQIAASGTQPDTPAFVVLEEEGDELEGNTAPATAPQAHAEGESPDGEWSAGEHDSRMQKNNADWRDEVAERVNRYRERRGSKEPRYPSLRLKFEGHEPSWRSTASQESAVSALGTAALSLTLERQGLNEVKTAAEEPSAKIIEFPRPLILPTVTDELAEPILDRPRIIEAPELVPPPPALGGISIEQSAEEPSRQAIEVPLQAASITRRVAAVTVDAAIVGAALALFGYIFLRMTGVSDGWRHPNLIVAVIPIMFWFAYQYLFTVHARKTPGTALTRMSLHTFAGQNASRNLRRFRVLTSMLSAVSLGLGYAWCLLDEDQLCWHDRITRTYLAPQRTAAS